MCDASLDSFVALKNAYCGQIIEKGFFLEGGGGRGGSKKIIS